MKRMALMILLVLMVAIMVPMLAQADCPADGSGLQDPVHCDGDPTVPEGFVGVDIEGACYGLNSANDPPVMAGEGPCPEH